MLSTPDVRSLTLFRYYFIIKLQVVSSIICLLTWLSLFDTPHTVYKPDIGTTGIKLLTILSLRYIYSASFSIRC
uniref:Uncharacterized protein n=1 Tax=Hyaloperonospora arabidopsidis (strain Emoy2) TaxID=559515 RepID=M4BVE4_HYAAE